MPRQIDNGDFEEDRAHEKAFPATKRANKSLSQDIEVIDLDLTPFMNILMVLIPFLAVMAVLTRIAILEFSLPPAQAGGAAASQRKDLDISIVITEEGYRIVGTAHKLDLVPKHERQVPAHAASRSSQCHPSRVSGAEEPGARDCAGRSVRRCRPVYGRVPRIAVS